MYVCVYLYIINYIFYNIINYILIFYFYIYTFVYLHICVCLYIYKHIFNYKYKHKFLNIFIYGLFKIPIYLFLYLGMVQQDHLTYHTPNPAVLLCAKFPSLSSAPQAPQIPISQDFCGTEIHIFCSHKLGICHLVKGQDCSSPGAVN